jgi:hypothetical protein
MIVVLAQWLDWARTNAVWLMSLGLAAGLNALFILLATWAPQSPRHAQNPPAKPRSVDIEIIRRFRVPPPPNLNALRAEAPPATLPTRFKPRQVQTGAPPPQTAQDMLKLPPRLRLNLDLCRPTDPDARDAANCAPPDQWRRADSDASDLLGPETQGYTLDEVAVARGWIKAKPRTGQDAMATTTDAILPETIFKDTPFPPNAIETTAGP